MNFPDFGQLNWDVSGPHTRVKKSSRKQITFPDAYSQKLESHCPTDKMVFPDPDHLLPTGFPEMTTGTKHEC